MMPEILEVLKTANVFALKVLGFHVGQEGLDEETYLMILDWVVENCPSATYGIARAKVQINNDTTPISMKVYFFNIPRDAEAIVFKMRWHDCLMGTASLNQ